MDTPLTDPSVYPSETLRRRRHTVTQQSSTSEPDDSPSSASELDDTPPPSRTPTRRPVHKMVNTAASYQPGKAPLLLDDSPSGLNAFLRAAKLYFRSKTVKEDEDKMAYLGAGLAPFPELYNWYASSAEVHEKKLYDTFVSELQRRALPRDYVWDTKARIRSSKQGARDFEDWIDDLRTEQLSLTERILPTREFIETLLFNMDEELSSIL